MVANERSNPAIGQEAPFDVIENAASEARRHATEGFTTLDLRQELKRSKRSRAWKRFGVVICVIIALVAVATAAVLLLFSVNQVNSSSMAPTLQSGQIVITSKDQAFAEGDVVAYRDGDAIIYGRVVAGPSKWVNIMGDNSLVVSDEQLTNKSAQAKTQSNTNVKISRQVPSGSYYILADSDTASINDIANEQGFVESDNIIGKSLFKVWPATSFGPIL